MYKIWFILAGLFLPLHSYAQTRQLEAHEHGAARVMMAMEGEKLQLEFEVSSDSLVGFEHFPEADKDREVFATAMTTLSDPTKLFKIPVEAECMPVGIRVSQTLFSGEGEHHEEEHHEDGDDHDESKSGKDHDHDKEGDHDEHGKEAHSEFHASYLWNCHHADDLDSLQTRLIKVFPRIEEVRVQWIVGDRQGALELENQDGLFRGWR